MNRPGNVRVLTHQRPDEVVPALTILRDAARAAGVEVRLDRGEADKHGLVGADGIALDDGPDDDLCVVFGGDGTILRALRRYAGTGVPVFAVNYGAVGFLATIDPPELSHGIERAFAGDFEVLMLPGIEVANQEAMTAFNDVAVHRRPGERVAQLAYAVGGEEIGRVRCDGLVVATPAGSTGYNLANGGPVLAWGVEGYVVSFIAPHSLTARALVVAPADRLQIHNVAREEIAEVAIDGRPCIGLEPGQALELHFADDRGSLAQMPGSTFYRRVREKFGRLSA